jgi:DNA-directed RNA polymerase specialized sigma24 family protein
VPLKAVRTTAFINGYFARQKYPQTLVDAAEARRVRWIFLGAGVPDRKQNLPQLYRFCFLMLGDSRKAQEVFHATLREAAVRAAHGELPNEPFWIFREARWRCLEESKTDVQAEPLEMEEHEITPEAPLQIEQLDPAQLAVWISAASEPQRTALALFYLNEFDYREILDLAELKLSEFARLLALGRRQFQAWLNTMAPQISKI